MPYDLKIAPFVCQKTEDASPFIDCTDLFPELVELMNTRYLREAENFEDCRGTDLQDELEILINAIISDTEAATDEEIALLYYLHGDGETNLWFDDFDDQCRTSYGSGPVIREGSTDYAIIAHDDIEEAFKEYATGLINEIDIPNIPEHLRAYFDYEQRIHDLEMDGYGQMSGYDGNDNEVIVGQKCWHVFRLN